MQPNPHYSDPSAYYYSPNMPRYENSAPPPPSYWQYPPMTMPPMQYYPGQPPYQYPPYYVPPQPQNMQPYPYPYESPHLPIQQTQNQESRLGRLPKTEISAKLEEMKPKQLPEQARQNKKLQQMAINRRGHWTEDEHYTYLKFVRKNKDLFMNSAQKKLNRVFKMMALEIPTRTACQCRSHFSKFNPFEVSLYVRRKLVDDEKVYQRIFEKKEKQSDSNIQVKLNESD